MSQINKLIFKIIRMWPFDHLFLLSTQTNGPDWRSYLRLTMIPLLKGLLLTRPSNYLLPLSLSGGVYSPHSGSKWE